ncbi:MAG: Trm112 family protein [Anaerolineae bacterium]
MEATPPFDPELLELIRCPEAVHYTDHGSDPGKLTLEKGCWLVCADSGYKYPIIKGIPVLLSEEGAKWKDTSVDSLPVPPPGA